MKMSAEEMQKKGLAILQGTGAVIIDGHFVYNSRRHGSEYVNKDIVFTSPADADEMCEMMAELITDWDAEVIIGPAMGSVGYALVVGIHLEPTITWPFVTAYAEPIGDTDFKIRDSFLKRLVGKRVVIVEDILTTGGTVKRLIKKIREAGGIVVGVVAMCNRGGVTAEELEVEHLASVVSLAMDSWEAADCPFCKEGIPVNTELGHGAKFLEEKEKARA